MAGKDGGKAGKLTPKQAVFVGEYLIDLNATQAAIRSGYSPKTADAIGRENLRKPLISEAIQKAQLERSKRVQYTGDDAIDDLKRIKDMAMDENRFNEAIKAIEVIGKFSGFNAPEKKEISGPGGSPLSVVSATMTDEEKKKLILMAAQHVNDK